MTAQMQGTVLYENRMCYQIVSAGDLCYHHEPHARGEPAVDGTDMIIVSATLWPN